MTELQRNEAGLIVPPASVLAQQERRNERAETLGELRGWLEGEHRRALEEDPRGSFKIRTPLELLENLTPAERAETEAFERQTHARLAEPIRAKAARRRAYVMAGGTAEDFDRNWSQGGEQKYLEERAAEILRGSGASSPHSPY